MKFEIRPAVKEEMEAFKHVAFTALVMSPEVMPPEIVHGINPDWTLCAFEKGKLATSYAAWPLMMQINGAPVPVAGITCVGTLPVYRGHGHLGQVISQHFKILHEKGEQPIAALYASRASIYQRFGFAVVSTRYTYHVDPGYLQFALPRPNLDGRFRELNDDEFPVLSELYGEFRAERHGYIKRGKESWLVAILKPPATPGQFINKILYEENGKPTGYIIYTSEPLESAAGMPRHRIHIRDLVWLTSSAYDAIWDYLSKMKLADHISWDRVPPDDPLPHLLLEPRMLNLTAMDGLLGRIVDIERALTKRTYNSEGTLTFEIQDDLCPWNNGRWQLETAGNQSRIRETTDNPDVTMPISTLAMLLFGQISATEAARMGRLDVRDTGELCTWDHVMHTKYRPFCADLF